MVWLRPRILWFRILKISVSLEIGPEKNQIMNPVVLNNFLLVLSAPNGTHYIPEDAIVAISTYNNEMVILDIGHCSTSMGFPTKADAEAATIATVKAIDDIYRDSDDKTTPSMFIIVSYDIHASTFVRAKYITGFHNDENKFVVVGLGQVISTLTFDSPDIAMLFAERMVNTLVARNRLR